MSQVISTCAKGAIIVKIEDRYLFPLYEDMLSPLVGVCKHYGAVIDLTFPEEPIVLNTSASCRRAIKRLYGQDIQKDRQAKAMYLNTL